MQLAAAEPDTPFFLMFLLALVLVMLYEPWLMYRWILDMRALADRGHGLFAERINKSVIILCEPFPSHCIGLDC